MPQSDYARRIAELEVALRQVASADSEPARKHAIQRARAVVYLGDERSNSVSQIQDKRKRVTFAGRSNGRTLTDSPDLLALRMARDWEVERDLHFQESNRPAGVVYSPNFWENVRDKLYSRIGEWYAQVLPPPAVISAFEYYGSFHGVETSHYRMVERANTPNALADAIQ